VSQYLRRTGIIYYLPFLILLFSLSARRAFSQTINFRTYSGTDGLANSNIYYSLQDSKGFLWIASSSGINRFDGKHFELFTTDDGLADNEVLRIYEDSRGRIWFLNFNGRLGYYYDGKFFNPENDRILNKAITKASITFCFEDSANRLWFATNQQQIIEIDGEKVTIHGKADKQMDISNTFIFEDEQNRVMAANNKAFYFLEGKIVRQAPAKYLPVSFKSSQYNYRTKKLLFLSDKGLIEYARGRFKVIKTIPKEIIDNQMGTFLIHKSDLWISSMNNGLFILKPDGKTVLHYLAQKIISDTMLDRDGNIWVTTLGEGLIILPAQTENLLQYTAESGLPENSIYSVIADRSGKIWLGLKSGSISQIDGKNINLIDLHFSSSSYNPIKKLEVDKNRNTIWFAANNVLGEMKVKNPAKDIRFLKEKNNLDFSPKSFSISKKGKLAFSLASGVYILADKNKPLIFETGVNLPGQRFFKDRAFKVFYDSKERLWFSNVNGLFRYSENKTDTLSKYSDIFSKRVTDMVELPDGNIVIGTYGYGLVILDNNNKITQIGLKDGLTSNICRKVAFDGKYIWLTTFSGVDKFEYKAAKRVITTYKIKNGLTSDEVLDIFIENKNIFLGTNEGLTVLPRNEPLLKFSPPLFYITSFSANGKPYKLKDVPRFNYDTNNISVTFTAINFTQSDEIYQYRLKEDAPWVQTINNTIEFGSLEPGEYKLSIRAKIQDSDWSSPALAVFTIKPAFWQRWWFLAAVYLLITLLLVGLAYLYFKKQRQVERDKLSIQAKIISLEQRALQAMMNPHFVFNIMNSIQYFINTKDSQSANQVLTGFARLIRKNLEICTKSYITLDEEIVYLKLYLSLEKLRFGEKMTYDIQIDEDLDTEEILIPTMLLQPFVENAIWHGIMPHSEGGTIKIQVEYEDNELTVLIIDNGVGIENSMRDKSSNHVSRGMQITRDRINLLNKGKKSQISIKTHQTGVSGTNVTVKIPV
jgi:ligand-binding sensor domain-containing protein